jgi:hypothetical protein
MVARSIGNTAHSQAAEPVGLEHLDGDHHHRLGTTATALAATSHAADKGLIDFDRAAEPFAFGAHHRHSEPLEHGPRHPVSDAKCSLKCLRRQTILRGSHVPGGLKPSGQRRPRLVQEGSSGHCPLMAAGRAHEAPTRMPPRRRSSSALRANEATGPGQLSQPRSAGRIVGIHLNELAVRARLVTPGHQSGQRGVIE